MASSAEKGAHYKARSRKWFEAMGYTVASLEVVHWIFLKDPKPGQPDRMPTKRDQLGSDLLAVSATETIFIQSKGGDGARIGNFPDAFRKFAEFTFPAGSKQWVVAWPTGAREPRIIDCTGARNSAERQPDQPRARKTAAPRTTLF